MDEYIGKLFRNENGIFIETSNNNLIKIDINIDDVLAKDSLLGIQPAIKETFEEALNQQLILAGLKKR